MFRVIPIEALLAVGYAAFLVLLASALEFMAERCHNRARQIEIVGFRYHSLPDHWECPMGEKLHRIETDWKSRIVRYRAPAHSCNACSIKQDCTRSDEGREVEQRLAGWLDSEVRRFHRGASLALVFLAVVVLAIEMLRAQLHGTWLLVTALAAVTATGVRLASRGNR